jgi:hypothetical protein
MARIKATITDAPTATAATKASNAVVLERVMPIVLLVYRPASALSV